MACAGSGSAGLSQAGQGVHRRRPRVASWRGADGAGAGRKVDAHHVHELHNGHFSIPFGQCALHIPVEGHCTQQARDLWWATSFPGQGGAGGVCCRHQCRYTCYSSPTLAAVEGSFFAAFGRRCLHTREVRLLCWRDAAGVIEVRNARLESCTPRQSASRQRSLTSPVTPSSCRTQWPVFSAGCCTTPSTQTLSLPVT